MIRSLAVGLSPRGRGNPRPTIEQAGGQGSIPAWAGKPTAASHALQRARVYPRVGGETGKVFMEIGDNRGLSPRGRGNLVYVGALHMAAGSIPAWAGKP